MKFFRFPFALLVAGLLLSSSLSAMAASVSAPTYDVAAKKDKPPRPTPTPGPRDGGDED